MIAPLNDGGPAFPGSEGTSGYGNAVPIVMPSGDIVFHQFTAGMSLRDHFAGVALGGMLVNPQKHDMATDDAALARCCYGIADAMLAERARKTTTSP